MSDLVIDKIKARLEAIQTELPLTEVLRTATPQQAANYIENNVTTLATAKEALKLMARMLIILRDQIPNIRE